MTERGRKGGSNPSSSPPLPIKQAMSREHRPLCEVGVDVPRCGCSVRSIQCGALLLATRCTRIGGPGGGRGGMKVAVGRPTA
jgi:hypothetical protein